MSSAVTDPLVQAIAERTAALLRPALEHYQSVQPRLMTVDQAGIYLGRTGKAVRQLVDRGTLPAVRADGRVMLDREDLDRWIRDNKVSA